MLRNNLIILGVMGLFVGMVGASAPQGDYSIDGYIGDYDLLNPTIVDEDHIYFNKTGSVEGGTEPWLVDYGEDFETIWEIGESPLQPNEIHLMSAHPNPFNPTTTIRFELPEACWVKLEVFDLAGRIIGSAQGRPLRDGLIEAGSHQVAFDGSGLASGIYLCRLTAGSWSQTQKLVLLK